MLFFFFFKQKTAYEMRISDWSSDVCSSDLSAAPGNRTVCNGNRGRDSADIGRRLSQAASGRRKSGLFLPRSEEHTSELQSLMRISYAVLCLKKNKKNQQRIPTTSRQKKTPANTKTTHTTQRQHIEQK